MAKKIGGAAWNKGRQKIHRKGKAAHARQQNRKIMRDFNKMVKNSRKK